MAPLPAQRVPDSPLDGKVETLTADKSGGSDSTEGGLTSEPPSAFPTDSRERARDAKNQRKAQGIAEKEVKKKVFKVEDHYDDCGDDLSSLGPDLLVVGTANPYYLDSDDELVDWDYDAEMLMQSAFPTYPIDPSTVAKPIPGTPAKGRDPRAKPPSTTACPARRCFRARDDWEHSRVVGECSYPHDEPWLPGCVSCQKRKPRWADGHSFRSDHCRWSNSSATRLGRQLAGSARTTPPRGEGEA